MRSSVQMGSWSECDKSNEEKDQRSELDRRRRWRRQQQVQEQEALSPRPLESFGKLRRLMREGTSYVFETLSPPQLI